MFILSILLVLLISCRSRNGSNNNSIFIGDPYTEIKGNISGRLLISDSPFLANENINVQSLDTLIIDAGVIVYFEQDKRIVIEGMIIVNGEEQEPVIFRTFDGSSWLGISILNSAANCIFKYFIIQQVSQARDDLVTNGALEILNSNAVFANCTFKYNSSVAGGGIYADGSSLDIRNCVFRNNSAENFGGAMFLENSTSTIINNTFFSNFCTNFGGGIVLDRPGITELQNNVFYKSLSVFPDPHIALISGDSTNVFEQFNFLPDGSMNPLFKSTDDLHLDDNSPCIDKGNPESQFNDTDGTRNDQGAYGGPGGNW